MDTVDCIGAYWSFYSVWNSLNVLLMTQSDAPNEGIGKIPQWVIDYNDAGYTSGAGKAVKILMNIVSDHEFKRSEYLSEINSLRDQLSKEREMRKELLEAIEDLKLYESSIDVLENIESLIAKASELDKNKG